MDSGSGAGMTVGGGELGVDGSEILRRGASSEPVSKSPGTPIMGDSSKATDRRRGSHGRREAV